MIVEKLMSGEFFNEKLGLRTYTQYILSYTLEDQYHRGPHTFWPFSGAIVAQGFDRLGFKQEAAQILHSLLLGLSDFESFVELFQLQGDKVTLWNSTETPQTSSLNQAWTAAAAYYAAGYLINAGQTKHHLIIKLIRDAITASSTGLKTIKKPLSKKIKL